MNTSVTINRILLIVFDGFGIGSYDGENSDSFQHACNGEVNLPKFSEYGLYALYGRDNSVLNKHCLYGKTRQQSPFCCSYSAHWEMVGNIVYKGTSFLNGFPSVIVGNSIDITDSAD